MLLEYICFFIFVVSLDESVYQWAGFPTFNKTLWKKEKNLGEKKIFEQCFGTLCRFSLNKLIQLIILYQVF